MSGDEIPYALLVAAWCGFLWGEWWADRRRKQTNDVGIRMLGGMLQDIIEKRKIVGRAMTISSTHKFECMGEKLSVIVEAAGDPSSLTIEGEANASD